MLQVLPRWRVTVTLPDGSTHIVWMSNHFGANVMRAVADLHFGANPLVQPVRVEIERADSPPSGQE